jgi:O-antigen/teichoic acid export membrane protein
VATGLLAWWLQSVWALVFGGVIGSIVTTLSYFLFLPGPGNKFKMDHDSFWEIFNFGKWVLLSTAAQFVMMQGDRATLGLFVSLETLGIYSIGYFFGSVPFMLHLTVQNRVILPLYRVKNPLHGYENQMAIFRARRLVSWCLLMLAVTISFFGPWIVEALYDSRYVLAGPMITLYSISVVPLVTLNSVSSALMGLGDSRKASFVNLATSVILIVFLFLGIKNFGVLGALLAPGLAVLATYPIRLAFALQHKVFDPVQDIGFTIFGFLLVGLSCAFHFEELLVFFKT